MRPSGVVVGAPTVADATALLPLRVAGRDRTVWLATAEHGDVDTGAAADAALVLGYGLALHLGVDCTYVSPVATTLRERIEDFGAIQRSWYRHLGRPAVTGPTRPDTGSPTGGARALLFSGGLDSFHSAITERERLDLLVFVLGADIALGDDRLASHVRTRLGIAAAELGVPLLTVVTNVREVTDTHAPWESFVGSAMCAVSMALAPRVGRVLYSATYGRAVAGRRTDRDALSSDRVTVLRHAGAPDRVTKARAVGGHPLVRSHLRVCWENRDDAYNCGRCQKCVATMRDLGVAGLLAGVETLPAHVDGSVPHVAPRARWATAAAAARRRGHLPRRLRPAPSRFAGDNAPFGPGPTGDLARRGVELGCAVAAALRPVLAGHREVVLVELSPTNVGDGALGAGTRRLLDRWGIRVVHEALLPWLDAEAIRRLDPGVPVLISGGGNLGSLWPHIPTYRRRILTELADRRVIQLPQSVRLGDAAAAARALTSHPDLTVFVRDEASAHRLAAVGVEARLCPDMALALAGPELPMAKVASRRVLWLSRDDHERGPVRPPHDVALDDVDLGDPGRLGAIAEALALRIGQRTATAASARLRTAMSQRRTAAAIGRVASAPVVVTERLHGHILCLLTATPHVVLPDAHGKILDFVRTWDTLGDDAILASNGAEAVAIARRLAARHGNPVE